jgi:hypothetical protein
LCLCAGTELYTKAQRRQSFFSSDIVHRTIEFHLLNPLIARLGTSLRNPQKRAQSRLLSLTAGLRALKEKSAVAYGWLARAEREIPQLSRVQMSAEKPALTVVFTLSKNTVQAKHRCALVLYTRDAGTSSDQPPQPASPSSPPAWY